MSKKTLGTRIMVLALAAVLFGLFAPGAVHAKIYPTITGTVSVTLNGSTVDVSAAYSTPAGDCGSGGDNAPTFLVEWVESADYPPAGAWSAAASYGSNGSPATDLGAVSPYNYNTGTLSSGTYYFRVIYDDAQGIGSCGGGRNVAVEASNDPVTIAAAANDTTVSTFTNQGATDTTIALRSTYTGDSNNSNSVSVTYRLAGGGGYTAISETPTVTRASKQWDVTVGASTGILPGTAYDFQIAYTDGDGVTGSPMTLLNQSTTYLGLGVGTVTTGTITDTSVVVNAPVDSANSDTNSNATVQYAFKGSTSITWHNFGSAVAAKTNQSATVTPLNVGVSYNFRATWADANGIYDQSTRASLGSPYTSNTANATTTGGVPCEDIVDDCADCHSMPPSAGDHTSVSAHQGDSTAAACALCHYNYATSEAPTAYTVSHSNLVMNIITSVNVADIRGGYYKGLRNATSLWNGGTPNSNNVCAATYCHGGGDSPIWSTGSVSCGSCHLIGPAGGKHGTHNAGYVGAGNNSSAGAYNFGCYNCHYGAGHSGGPYNANGDAFVTFDNVSAPMNPSGTYAYGAFVGTDNGHRWSNGTCSSLYCHSNALGTPAYTNRTWNGAALPTDCTGCHAGNKTAASIMDSGSHTGHVNNSDANLATLGCALCHANTVSADRTISNKANHVNGAKNVSAAGWTGTQCTSQYCHSSGQTTPTYRTVTWGGSAITTCDACHGADNDYTLVDGAPDYTNGGPGVNTSNSHYVASHLSAATHCVRCHKTTVNAFGNITATGNHLNGAKTVSLANGTWNSGPKTCTNTGAGCHNSGDSPAWGATASCADCHLSTGADVDDYASGGNTANINSTEWTTTGHGKTSGTYTYTNRTAANLSCTSSNDADTVGGCHRLSTGHNYTYNPFRLVSSVTIKPTVPNSLCTTTCHTTGIANHEKAITGGTKYSTWNFTPKCVDCHDPHGDNGGNDTAQPNNMMIQSKIPAGSGSNTYGVPQGGLTNMDFPAETTRPGSLTRDSFATATFDGICQSCHRDGFGSAFDVNSDGRSSHNVGTVCTGCHDHASGFKGAGECKTCHGTGGSGTAAGRENIELAFQKNSHHVNATWAQITNATCAQCHLEGNRSDGSVNGTYHKALGGGAVDLRIYSSYPTMANVSAVHYTTDNNAVNAHCMGCHGDSNTATPFYASTGNTDNGTPGMYDTLSGGANAGSIKARYADTTTAFFSKYDPNRFNVVPRITKAYSPHGNSANNQRGVQTDKATAWGNDNGNTNVACLDCHNSHGSSALAEETSATQSGLTYTSNVGSFRGGLIKETSSYNPANGSSSPVTWSATADLCWDCHLGDGGAGVPKTYSSFGNNAAIKGYYDPGRWRSSDNWVSSFTYKTSGTGNGAGSQKGGHFGRSSDLKNAASNPINGNCNVCHDPHGIAATASNRDFRLPALKGTWMTSPYKEDRAASTSSVADDSTYGGYIAGDIGNTARQNPRFNYNNPQGVGAGFGRGISGTNWGYGGSGADGYFIDDNTFGTNLTHDTDGNGTITDTNNRRPWTDDGTITAYNITSGLTGMPATMNDTLFAGLCTTCHSKTNLMAANMAYDNGETGGGSIYVHNTVAGWAVDTKDSDLFRQWDANMHMMSYRYTGTQTGSRVDCEIGKDPDSPEVMPGGYRWSVDAGTSTSGKSMNGTSATDDATPSGYGGQSNSGTIQTGFHKFPCSKCHTAHTSKLPRLMKTNCLDVGDSTTAPKHADGGTGENNYAYPNCGLDNAQTQKNYMTECHNMRSSNTPAGTAPNVGGGWNVITGW